MAEASIERDIAADDEWERLLVGDGVTAEEVACDNAAPVTKAGWEQIIGRDGRVAGRKRMRYPMAE